MTPAAKIAFARDLEQTRRKLGQARISVKEAAARSDELSKIDMDLFARSRGKISNARDRFKQKQQNAALGSRHFGCPIDRKMLERHLRQAERHVAAGQQHISRQRELIAQLERDDHDTSAAKSLLAQFEELQMMHIAHRDRLGRELGKAAFCGGG